MQRPLIESISEAPPFVQSATEEPNCCASVAGAIAEHAARTPGDVAVTNGCEVLTYAELENRSNRLARYLVRNGIKTDVPVGIFVERSAAFEVGALAILKSGGAYLPLDPIYPRERLRFMLEEAQAPIMISK